MAYSGRSPSDKKYSQEKMGHDNQSGVAQSPRDQSLYDRTHYDQAHYDRAPSYSQYDGGRPSDSPHPNSTSSHVQARGNTYNKRGSHRNQRRGSPHFQSPRPVQQHEGEYQPAYHDAYRRDRPQVFPPPPPPPHPYYGTSYVPPLSYYPPPLNAPFAYGHIPVPAWQGAAPPPPPPPHAHAQYYPASRAYEASPQQSWQYPAQALHNAPNGSSSRGAQGPFRGGRGGRGRGDNQRSNGNHVHRGVKSLQWKAPGYKDGSSTQAVGSTSPTEESQTVTNTKSGLLDRENSHTPSSGSPSNILGDTSAHITSQSMVVETTRSPEFSSNLVGAAAASSTNNTANAASNGSDNEEPFSPDAINTPQAASDLKMDSSAASEPELGRAKSQPNGETDQDSESDYCPSEVFVNNIKSEEVNQDIAATKSVDIVGNQPSEHDDSNLEEGEIGGSAPEDEEDDEEYSPPPVVSPVRLPYPANLIKSSASPTLNVSSAISPVEDTAAMTLPTTGAPTETASIDEAVLASSSSMTEASADPKSIAEALPPLTSSTVDVSAEPTSVAPPVARSPSANTPYSPLGADNLTTKVKKEKTAPLQHMPIPPPPPPPPEEIEKPARPFDLDQGHRARSGSRESQHTVAGSDFHDDAEDPLVKHEDEATTNETNHAADGNHDDAFVAKSVEPSTESKKKTSKKASPPAIGRGSLRSSKRSREGPVESPPTAKRHKDDPKPRSNKRSLEEVVESSPSAKRHKDDAQLRSTKRALEELVESPPTDKHNKDVAKPRSNKRALEELDGSPPSAKRHKDEAKPRSNKRSLEEFVEPTPSAKRHKDDAKPRSLKSQPFVPDAYQRRWE